MTYKNPETRKATRREYYQTHKPQWVEYNRNYRLRHPEAIKQRDRRYYLNHKEEADARNRRWREAHRERRRMQAAEYRLSHPDRNKEVYRRLRGRVLAALGGKCARCSFADRRALQVDHVDGGGLRELRHYKNRQYSYYLNIIHEAGSGKYQLLCANCNWIKRAERKEHVP